MRDYMIAASRIASFAATNGNEVLWFPEKQNFVPASESHAEQILYNHTKTRGVKAIGVSQGLCTSCQGYFSLRKDHVVLGYWTRNGFRIF